MARATFVCALILLCAPLASAAPPEDEARVQASKPSRSFDRGPTDEKAEGREYLRRREEYILLRRGLPYPKDKPNARALAIRQMEAQELKRYGRRAATQYLPGSRQSQLNTTSWTAAGPAPIPNGDPNAVFTSNSWPVIPMNGRVNTIAVDPRNASVVYIGASTGGVYRSLDGGTTWTPLMDGALTLSIGSIAVDPLQPSTIVVGTGDGDGGDQGGVGLYKVTDADGLSPVVSGPYNQDTTGADVLTGNCVTRVLISPTDDNIVFVSTTYAFSPHQIVSPPARGLFRSTNFMSGSPSFTKLPITAANGGNRRVTDMVFDPNDPNKLLANVGGLTNVNGVADGGIYLVTGALGATPVYTQTLNLDAITNVKFAANKTGSTVTLFAATEEANGCSGVAGALRKSADEGQTWSAPLTATRLYGFCGFQCWYDLAVAVDPTNASHILLGGQYDDPGTPPCVASGQLLSVDGGSSFSSVGSLVHPDTHAIAFAPSDPTIAYAGDDGGIFKSTDGGTTWSSVNTSGFSATLFVSFVSHPLDRHFSIGGTQDNGTNMIRSDGSWLHVDFGDGGYAEIDRNAGDAYPLLMYHTYTNEPTSLGFARVTNVNDAQDGGWLSLGFGYGNVANGLGGDPNVLFYAPMALGPGNPSTLYFGTDRLYRSTDAGLTMTLVSQGPLSSGNAISSIAVSPQDDNVRVVALGNGRVFATTTGSATMTDITGALPAFFASAVTIDPNAKNTAYVAFSGYGLAAGQHVWKNSNVAGGGANWVESGSGIPDVPVDAIVVDPLNSNDVYAGTDIGVYASTDGGNSWAPFETGMPFVPVFYLDIQSPSRVLRAATYGRGIWEIQIGGAQYPALSIGTVSAAPTSGNGNAVIEPGENGAITVQVTNHGVVTATGVAVTISSTTPGVTIVSGASALPNLAPGASATNATPLAFDVAYATTCGSGLNFVITVSAAGAPPVSRPFRLALGGATGTPVTFNYTGSVLPIPDGDINGANGQIAVSGFTAPVAKVTVTIGGSSCSTAAGSTTVGIDHTWVGNLQLYLISPAGTKVPLVVNSAGSGVNMCGTVFDDSASTPFSQLTYFNNPYTGTYSPYAPLSTFAGESANGTWTLRVVDGVDPYDTGSLRAFSITITPAACASVLPAPLNLSATAATTTSASVTWSPVTGADHYDVYRSTNIATGFTLLTSPTTNALSDGGLTAGTTYLYKVRASSTTGGTSDYSNIDPVTLVSFTDDPIVAGTTIVKATHLGELRQAVNAMRTAAGLAPASFTDPTLSTTTLIKAIHVAQLRTALAAARAALGLTTVYTDDPLTGGSTPVKAIHIQELRDSTK